jgi:quinone-modifying oxidoreductase subunit QmoA
MEAEDTLSGERVIQEVDLVVLATGLVPAGVGEADIQGGFEFDEHGFLAGEQPSGGLLAAGCAKRPVDVAACVRDATGVAMKALHSCVE